ncbi:MAG: DUF4177 domain-containing protein [Deltaproteobacteria bacterium]|nr:DUF4177 domain-containing protein [Deltaproteobacteria bacterium]
MSQELFFKVREISDVDEDTLTAVINEMVTDGWKFDAMHFAMRESSKRPAMAFLVFTKTETPE